MSKILKNQTASSIFISDTGVLLPASPVTFTIPPEDYLIWAASSDIIGFVSTPVATPDVIVSDGSSDLNISDGVDLIKGIFPNPIGIQGGTDQTEIGNVEDALKVVPSGATQTELIEILDRMLCELKLHSFHLSQITDTDNEGLEL